MHDIGFMQEGKGAQCTVDYFEKVMLTKVDLVLQNLIEVRVHEFHHQAYRPEVLEVHLCQLSLIVLLVVVRIEQRVEGAALLFGRFRLVAGRGLQEVAVGLGVQFSGEVVLELVVDRTYYIDELGREEVANVDAVLLLGQLSAELLQLPHQLDLTKELDCIVLCVGLVLHDLEGDDAASLEAPGF